MATTRDHPRGVDAMTPFWRAASARVPRDRPAASTRLAPRRLLRRRRGVGADRREHSSDVFGDDAARFCGATERRGRRFDSLTASPRRRRGVAATARAPRNFSKIRRRRAPERSSTSEKLGAGKAMAPVRGARVGHRCRREPACRGAAVEVRRRRVFFSLVAAASSARHRCGDVVESSRRRSGVVASSTGYARNNRGRRVRRRRGVRRRRRDLSPPLLASRGA